MKSSYAKLTRGRYKPEGWSKLKKYCDLAKEDGWEWAWMDTCCIDKTNTSDTQEAINAMFRWYKESMICYVYLEDVDRGKKNFLASFSRARWFTRGWTLQELIAPTSLLFVDKNWLEIIDKNNGQEHIERATGIDPEKLRKFHECSIRERFSWASQRQTTLIEDRAYSLLGLFGINMPLIYGEGDRAFLRLQHELIRTHDDASLLLWEAHNYNEENVIPRRLGALAPSLSCFQPRSDEPATTRILAGCNLSISASGLHLDANLMFLNSDKVDAAGQEWRHDSLFLAFIGGSYSFRFGIYLIKMSSAYAPDSFERVGHLTTILKPPPGWDGGTNYTSLGLRSIIIKDGFDLSFHTAFMRVSPLTGFKILASCRALLEYDDPLNNVPVSSQFILLSIPYRSSRFLCDPSGIRKGEYFITSFPESLLYWDFDVVRDSPWRFQVQHGASEKFELILGTSQYNPDALLLAPGQLPSRTIRLKGSPGTVRVKIRPRAAMENRSQSKRKLGRTDRSEKHGENKVSTLPLTGVAHKSAAPTREPSPLRLAASSDKSLERDLRRLGIEYEDLNAFLATLHAEHNTMKMAVQNPRNWHQDVSDISSLTEGNEEFLALLKRRQEGTLDEIQQAWDKTAEALLAAEPPRSDNPASTALLWSNFTNFARDFSFDSLVALFGSFAGDGQSSTPPLSSSCIETHPTKLHQSDRKAKGRMAMPSGTMNCSPGSKLEPELESSGQSDVRRSMRLQQRAEQKRR
ncbi:HET domain protein [Penicillium mononematosum]|uniref:HET domain protein n=1 Tax=Penicillium mononematosum TaxID=268346 RepID=UPI002546D955|nr:HET domain protein [Penicillium mononematosum]KAJ6190723.1 HET domain protein [Penicillium mononematosum]